jgi:hypothetical protein
MADKTPSQLWHDEVLRLMDELGATAARYAIDSTDENLVRYSLTYAKLGDHTMRFPKVVHG